MTMIPERYRECLPPYWYENKAAIQHFDGAGGEIDYQRGKKTDLEQQMNIQTATWGLVFWEYMFQVAPKFGDSYETRRARVIAKYRQVNPFTPAMAKEITQLFISPDGIDRIEITESPDTGYFYISVPLWSIYDIASWVHDIHKRKRVPHVFMPQLASYDRIEFVETIKVNKRRYHKVHEFRVGMTPLKYQNEVII